MQDYILKIAGTKNCEEANKLVMKLIKSNGTTIKNKYKEPSEIIKKLLKKNGYALYENQYVQWKPANIHSLSREISEFVCDKPNIDFMFDTGISNVEFNKGIFKIITENGIISSKKIIVCIGRSGWRLTNSIFSNFDILNDNNFAYFGFRAEISSSYMKNWNESHCSISKGKMLLGPMSWHGTVIPEDHDDLVISSWRSNEDRWYSDKASFSVICKSEFKNDGFQQAERLGKLAYVLLNNRADKIKIKEYLSTKNDISYIPEYKWFIQEFKEIEKIIPDFIDKGYMHLPNILTYMKNISLNKDFSSSMDGLVAAGESAGVSGIYAAALSGTIAALNITK